MNQQNAYPTYNQTPSNLDSSMTNLTSNMQQSTPTQKTNFNLLPKPSNPFFITNPNPYFGGERYRPPSKIFNPCTNFAPACLRTPNSDFFKRIIPWDKTKKDYVYATINPLIYRGKFNNAQLKAVFDKYLNGKPKDFTGAYSCVCVTGTLLLIAGLTGFFLSIFVFFKDEFNERFSFDNGWGYFFILVPFLFVLLILNFIWCARSSSNNRTKERYNAVALACRELSEVQFHGSHLRIQPGDWGAWLELLVVGPVKSNFVKIKSFFKGNNASMMKTKKKVNRQIPQSNKNGQINANRGRSSPGRNSSPKRTTEMTHVNRNQSQVNRNQANRTQNQTNRNQNQVNRNQSQVNRNQAQTNRNQYRDERSRVSRDQSRDRITPRQQNSPSRDNNNSFLIESYIMNDRISDNFTQNQAPRNRNTPQPQRRSNIDEDFFNNRESFRITSFNGNRPKFEEATASDLPQREFVPYRASNKDISKEYDRGGRSLVGEFNPYETKENRYPRVRYESRRPRQFDDDIY